MGTQGSKDEWQQPAEGQMSGWGRWEKPPTPYDRFMEEEGIPTFRGIGVRQLQDLPLRPWKRLGGRGTFLQLDGTESRWGMYVVEVPARGALNPEQHLYEEVIFVVEGRGTTEVWQEDESRKQVFEWNKGSLFAIPLNTHHRIVNATSEPALLLVGTTAPSMINLIQDNNFIFHCDYAFTSRYDASNEYFKPDETLRPEPVKGLAMQRTNLVPDIINCELPPDNRRSPGYRRIEHHMAGGTFYMFCGQHETGRYAKAHRHEPGAVLICIGGKGYTYTWPSELGTHPWADGKGEQVLRQDYEHVGMVSAAPVSGNWFHQHFSVGKEPLRVLAFLGPGYKTFARGGRPGAKQRDDSALDVNKGGWAIEYRDEDPHIRQEFAAMLAKEGVESRMTDEVYEARFEFTGEKPS